MLCLAIPFIINRNFTMTASRFQVMDLGERGFSSLFGLVTLIGWEGFRCMCEIEILQSV